MVDATKLTINTDVTAQQMAETIFGEGVSVESATYTGAATASGIYSGGDTTAPGLMPADTGVILLTGNAGAVTNDSGEANQRDDTSTNHNLAGDAQLTEIAGLTTYDTAVLTVSFIPVGTTLTMQLNFSSEEYLEYVDSGFNDAVGIFVNGVQAGIAVGDGSISIDNINTATNSNLYIDNPEAASVINSELDGVTITLTIKADVNPNELNTIKIGIADAGDGVYDSNVMIVADSVQTQLILNDDEITIDGNSTETLDVLANDEIAAGVTATITAINGNPVTVGDTVVLAIGEEITLLADGTLSITPEGDDDSQTFSYTVTSSNGVNDTALVTVNTVAYFASGTMIDTPDGPKLIDDLETGDMITTLDSGSQAIRWIGHSLRNATGNDAPVHVSKNAMG